MQHLQKYVAEGLAVFVLTLGVSLSLLFDTPLSTPIIAGLVVGLFVYTIGPISGAHINPAVTVGLWSVGLIRPRDALGYVAGQFAGAALALLLIYTLTGATPAPSINDSPAIAVAEAIGAFILVFGVSSVARKKVDTAASGLVVGGSLVVGILLALSVSNGVLNPAVALGINSISIMYVVGPLVGGVAGAWAYKWMAA